MMHPGAIRKQAKGNVLVKSYGLWKLHMGGKKGPLACLGFSSRENLQWFYQLGGCFTVQKD